ncbi:MAG: prepilin-type N-terminal cleavage/methylation domain-containing protein [Desulfosarcinaceae bacterium]|nr:prepilin-type N-terminal cleavage/methylation domain-containing protein [Desulfosarcinaceae bacterium]
MNTVVTAKASGFSLVEVIVAIVIGAIASVLLFQFMGGNMARVLTPLARIDQSYRLTAVMENISAHYKNLLLTDATPLATLDTDIQNGNVSTNTPYFGEYTPTATQYIEFAGGVESSCSVNCRILRVDLERGEHRITALFTN